MESKLFLQILVLLIISFIAVGRSQGTRFVFEWPGPSVVPETGAIKPPDSAFIELSDNGTTRTLVIQEDVMVTFDCTKFAESVQNMDIITPNSVTMVSWSRRRYDSMNNIVNSEPEDVVDDDDKFNIFGDKMEFLNITNPKRPTSAAENAESGEYICTACGTEFVLNAPPNTVCFDSAPLMLDITADPPTIDTSPGSQLIDSYLRFNVGNDMCLNRPLPQGAFGLDIKCDQDPAFPTAVDPAPVLTWSFNGMMLPPNPALPHSFLPFDNLQDVILSIDIDDATYQPSQYVGVYVCNRTNIFGQDSEMTVIANAETVTTTATITGINGDGCARFGLTSSPGTICAGQGEEVTINCATNSLSYSITGPSGQQSMNQDIMLTNIASGDSGVYTCSNGRPCFMSDNVTINVFTTGVPVIETLPNPIVTNMNTLYTVGTDICISSNNPLEIILTCGHDNDNPVLPAPTAIWTVPTRLTTPPQSAALTFSDSPLFQGTDSELSIDNDGDPIEFVDDLVGSYTCVLSNGQGSDTSTSMINIFPNIDQTMGGFILDPPEGRVTIGNASCLTRGGDPAAAMTRITCISNEGTFQTMWFRNGVELTSTSSVLTNEGPGEYVCVKSNPCGSINASTVILGPPTIAAAGAPPTDGPGVQFDVGQFVCANPSIGGNVEIQCPLPMLADPEYTTIMWTKMGDASFSFMGTPLTLPRTDPNLAGVYTCSILSGPNGDCGIASSMSPVAIQTTITAGSGFVTSPTGDQIIIGEDTCLPPAGDSLRIQCETTPTTTVTWTLNGNPISGNEFIDVTTEGEYICSIQDGCGSTISASSQVLATESVSISAMIVGLADNGCSRFTNVPATADVCVAEGEDVLVQCTPTVGGYTISLGGNIRSTNQTTSITGFTGADSGTYTCTGDMFECGTPTDSIIIVTPGVPPSITPPVTDPNNPPVFMNVSIGEDVCLPFGESVNLNCIASTGTPPVSYEWTKEPDTTVISTSNTITVNEIGTYRCLASNSIGSDSASSTIFEDIELSFGISSSSVPSRCSQLVNPPSNTDLCFFTGDTVVISCFSRVSNTPGIIQPGGSSGTLIIRELDESDTAFTCTASNECGNDTASILLLVEEPARIDRSSPIPPSSDTERNIGAGRPDEPVQIMENITVRLFCPFTGIDQPSTRWVRVNNDRTTTDVVEMPPNLVFVNETNNIILVIMNFSEDFEGTYRCVTNNNAGNDGGDVVLSLNAPEPGEWSTTVWSQCDPDCHQGMRMRVVTCLGVNSRIPLPDNRCIEEKPLTMERCLDRGPCFLDPLWVPQDWSACTAECGGGYRVRDLICQIPRTGETVADSMCDQQGIPSTFEYCNLHNCCTKDRYPQYCRLIKHTPLCTSPSLTNSRHCCWSCPQ